MDSFSKHQCFTGTGQIGDDIWPTWHFNHGVVQNELF